MIGHVALVLHAHLPYVRHLEHAHSLEERWLFEALWESYLPLVDMLDALERDRVDAPLTVSLSPTLVAMLCDERLRDRFEDHVARLADLCRSLRRRARGDARLGALVEFYGARLSRMVAVWRRCERDVPTALAEHARAGRIELCTTAVTHAFLPALDARSQRAQLALGRALFERHVGVIPLGMWLPECGFAEPLDEALAQVGARWTVVDEHGLALAHPRPPLGVAAPMLSPRGVAYLGRDAECSREVWSRATGYPGDPVYRDFYRDVGFDLPASELCGHLGPEGARLMTGLKLHRVTGPGAAKEPYDPVLAHARALDHAACFVDAREAALAAEPLHGDTPALAVAPYDAELFGHWWFEGPVFLEAVARRLSASAQAGRLRAVTPRMHLVEHPMLFVGQPGESSWGEGGFGDVWTGESTAHLWRRARRASEEVFEQLDTATIACSLGERALDAALVQLLLLQASDWAFQIHGGDNARYAEERVAAHSDMIRRLLAVTRLSEETDAARARDGAALVDDAENRFPLLAGLDRSTLRSAFASSSRDSRPRVTRTETADLG